MSQFDLDDLPSNHSDNEHFQHVVDRVVSRRGFLKSGLGLGAAAFLAVPLAAQAAQHAHQHMDAGYGNNGPRTAPKIGFAPVAASRADAIVVPPGYSAQIFAPWGDALFADSPMWKPDGTNTGAEQARQIGDNHDGMHFFPLHGKSGREGLLVMNHEYCNYEYLFGAGFMTPWTADKVLKAQNAHGASVIHIRQHRNRWEIVLGSKYNRRITGNTPMRISGPAAGHALMKTQADPTGTRVLGTLNNCANGFTPWGTYLTCEENFNGYFGTTSGVDGRDESMKRYGINARGTGYRWEEFDDRFDYAKEPNESNRFGWVVEIDPFDPTSMPVKRTALGRIKHENCAYAFTADRRVVVYMGDDQTNDYIYKFVSDGRFVPGKDAANRQLLDHGKLYVARFGNGATTGDFMGTGEWVLLDKQANPVLAADGRFADQAEVLIKTRLAADAVGATKMDRPEWIAVHPGTNEVYCALTNNSGRSPAQTDDANPRAANRFGQIVRWREAGNDVAAMHFDWDLFVIAGNPNVYAPGDLNAGSANIDATNTFNSPDGIGFDPDGRLWIQTDGNFSDAGVYAGQGNNQMLCADPATGEIRRFLVGPSGCEITGLTFTPDGRTMFINVQHPGEVGSHPNRPTPPAGVGMDDFIAANPLAFSRWPDAAGGRPRSATVIITKDDGGVIGS
ncbi:PhoX family phosphatase [Thauera sp. JM12B12]|uniref:PhoX family protein n=1 Tax=Thauera sp. JM12B12 TaxID=3142262 RepID=UPI0031F3B614